MAKLHKAFLSLEEGCKQQDFPSPLRIIKTRGVTEVTAVTEGCGFAASGGKNFCLARGGILHGLPGYRGYLGYPTCFCFRSVGYIVG